MGGRHSQTTRQQGTFAKPSENRQTKARAAEGIRTWRDRERENSNIKAGEGEREREREREEGEGEEDSERGVEAGQRGLRSRK